jgi:hypothetical protein
MKPISRVTNRDMGRVLFTLAEARKRPQRADVLEGLPQTRKRSWRPLLRTSAR